MNLFAPFLGSSQTQPPLPPFYPIYAKRFRQVSSFLARAVFQGVQVHLDEESQKSLGGPKVVVYSNHPGFWDPLLLALLTGRLWPQHPVISPIDSAALRTHRYFNGLGFFGLSPNTPSGLRSFIEMANACLECPGKHCLALTPEGRFSKPTARPLRLARGLALALNGHQGPDLTVVPVAIKYHLGSSPRPHACLMIGEPMLRLAGKPSATVSSLHQDLCGRLERTLDNLETKMNNGNSGRCLLSAW